MDCGMPQPDVGALDPFDITERMTSALNIAAYLEAVCFGVGTA